MTHINQINDTVNYNFLEVVRHIPILEMLIVNGLIKIWSTRAPGTVSGKLLMCIKYSLLLLVMFK